MSKTPTNFSVWMRDNLKDAFCGLITQDIDFVLLNSNDQYFIVEEKNYAGARTGPAQAVIYKMLDDILSTDDSFLGCHNYFREFSTEYKLQHDNKPFENDWYIYRSSISNFSIRI